MSDWSSDVCSSDRDSAPWPLSIPRLRLRADTPSRAALKLEEALRTLLDDRGRARLLREGMHAADLGAAPGGWTWVLTRHGVRVSAIDNGPLRQHVLDTGLVEHLRADGFHWQPPRPLDWMVCDMVEQPRRGARSEEHTSELQTLMRNSYAVFCVKKKH